MKDNDSLAMRTAPWTIPLFTIGIFILDLFTPLGVAVSILYVIPLLLTYSSPRTKDPLYFSAVVTALTWVDVLINPSVIPIPFALFNRTLGTMVIWLIAIGLVRYKHTEQELESAQVEQAHAEGLMMEAQQARYHADREAVRAVVGLEEAEEQLLISRLKLESIIESAMDAIITVDEDQKIVLFNRAAEQMFGCSTREAIGQPLDRFLPARFRDAHRHHIQTFGQSGVTSRKMGKLGTVKGLRSNREEFPIEAAISHIAVERKKYYTVILRDITERKQLEETLQAKETFTRDVLDSLPAHICVLGEDGVILRTNDAWKRFAAENSDPGSTIGKVGDNYLDVCRRAIARGESEVHAILHGIEAVLEGSEQTFSAEYPCHSPKEPRWFLLRVTPLKEASGVVLAHLNITSRKRAEENLLESQRQLTTLISNLPGYVYRCQNDPDWTLQYISEGVFDLTGYTADEYLTWKTITCGEKTHPDDSEHVWQEVQAALDQHRPFEMTYRVLTKSGEVKWVWERGEGIYATDGTLSYLEGFVTDVTERKRAEHLLRQSEERYRRLIAVSPYAILVNRGDRIIFANDQAIKLFGAVKADEILEKSPLDLFHPDYHAVVRDWIYALLEGSPQVPMLEEKILTVSGRPVEVEVSAARFTDEEGPAILVMLRDISERKRAEEQFRLAVESSPNGMLMVDEQGRMVMVNRQIEQQFGYDREDLIGQTVELLVPQRMRSHHASDRAEFLAHSESRAMGKGRDLFGMRKDGTEFPLEIGLNPIPTPNGMRVLASIVDISERKRAEQVFRRERDFIDAVLETAGALVVVLDRDGIIQRFNRACEQTTGYSSEEAIGKAVWDFLLIPEEVESVKGVFSRLTGGEPRNEHENYWVAKDGQRCLIAWTNTVMTNPQGNVDYVVATGINVTELKRVQEQLRKTERIAELGTLASGMAHEIGTPMNVILGRAEYLMDRVTEEPVKKGLQTIVTQVERITKVMNQLLSFARRKAPDRRTLDLRGVIDDGMEMFQERLAKSQIQVDMTLADPCPMVLADADQMSQVFINLVMNAVHAMPDGGTLRVSLAPEQQMVKLTVSDTGHGIPPEVIKKIFEPFFTTKEFGQGTGLGLTVVKGIIEEHQGSIAVESEEGKGTTFTILLPQNQ